jgi:beta-lactamase superfamily II metal-dependent hydrolase
MAAVIRAMDGIGTLFMPDATNNTRVFERMLDAIEEKDVTVAVPSAGQRFHLGDARITVLAPAGEQNRGLNDQSIVLRIEFGSTAFLFTGDAEALSEGEQLTSRRNLRADVLKVGHHGSSTGTGTDYLDAVSPRYAVISCGLNNTYNHPHREVMERLEERQIAVYRTDRNGTVTFTTDGVTITVRTER